MKQELTQHTRGPWRVGTPGPNGCYTVGTAQGLMVAVVAHSVNEPSQKEQAKANACLIAAAPEMLAAIGRLKDCLKTANANAEKFEREWYLRGDEIAALRKDAEPLTPCRLQELWNDAMHANRSSTNDAAMDFARAIEAERGIKPTQAVQS